ncbi:MAG: hypothetical protein ACR2PW_03220 [Gammaproteobacteria bacterium]
MVIGPADEYLIHQLPVPVAQTAGETNFYDRYWYNGYSSDGSLFFAGGLAVYPQLGIVDAAFSFMYQQKQYNLRASRHMDADRSRAEVGPIKIEVIEPLRSFRVCIDAPEQGFVANLCFQARFDPVEEIRHQYRPGNRVILDSTRVTQLGNWQGRLAVQGIEMQLEPADILGTKDRSWGIRPVGRVTRPEPESATYLEPQFFWLWAPCHLTNTGVILYRNDDRQGQPWNRGGKWQADAAHNLSDVRFETEYAQGTRRVQRATASGLLPDGRMLELVIEPIRRPFFMSALGYMHPEWGQGMDQGPLAVASDSYDLTQPDAQIPPWLHIQDFSRTYLYIDGKEQDSGCGVLEQLLLGQHRPSGFQSLLDPIL